jgi:hypothetical protein
MSANAAEPPTSLPCLEPLKTVTAGVLERRLAGLPPIGLRAITSTV